MKFIGVTEGLIQHLREHIIAGKFKPGQKLSEVELSSSLQTSRSPLREAFRVLSGEHLVDFIPRKGCFVSEISMEDCLEIYQAREMLECFAIELLRKRGIRKLPEVEATLKLTSTLIMPVEDDPAKKFAYLKSIANFHLNLVKSAGNRRLSAYFDSIFPNLARYQSIYVFIRGMMDQSQHEHERILACIADGKYGDAQDLVRNHIGSWSKLLGHRLPAEHAQAKQDEPVNHISGQR